MLEDKIYKALDECSHTLSLIKIKTKNKKKEYRQIENIIKNIKYVDDERVETLQKYLLKGTKVIIDGQIDYNSIQDDQGNWKNYFQLIANDIDIVKFVEVQEEDKKSNNKYKRNFRK